MKLKITINMECSNAAFDPAPAIEAMRIINDGTLAFVVETAIETSTPQVHAHIGRIIKDANGNTVGRIDAEVLA